MSSAWRKGGGLTRAATLNDAWSQFAVGKTLIRGCPQIKLTADRQRAWHGFGVG
jgi:hypothetical protein